MKMLIWENEQMGLYELTFDKQKLKDLYSQIILKYGYIREIELKRNKINNPKELLNYCDAYKDDLEILKVYENTTRIHKGRKRIPPKQNIKKYLYRFTAIDYPEIVHTMIRFLSQDMGDFSIFNKYINADTNVDYNNLDFYIEEGYMQYDNEAIKRLRESLDNEQNRIKYINWVILRRKLQAEYLSSFYNLFTIDLIVNSLIIVTEDQLKNYQLMRGIFELPTIIATGRYTKRVNNPNVIIQTEENIEIAKKNREFIDKVKGSINYQVKQLK